MAVVDEQIRVKIDALLSGMKEVQKLNTELKELQKVSGKKLSINTSSIETGLSKVTTLFRSFSGTADQALSSVESKASAAGISLAGISGPAAIAIGAVTAIGAVAVGAGAGLFALADKAATTGETIHDIAIQTKLSTETISAMKIAFEKAGSSIEEGAGGLTKFGSQLIKAAQGDKELRAELAYFGIDGKKAYLDTDGALNQFLKRFNELPATQQRNTAAAKLFKDRSGELIKVFDQAGGSLDNLKHEADGMGSLWSKESADAADAFKDLETDIGQRVDAIKNHLGIALLPTVNEVLKDIQKALESNAGAWDRWSDNIKLAYVFLRGFMGASAEAAKVPLWKQVIPIYGGIATGAAVARGATDATVAAVNQVGPQGPPIQFGGDLGGSLGKPGKDDLIRRGGGGKRKGKSQAEIDADAAKQAAEIEIKNAELIQKQSLESAKNAYDDRLTSLNDFLTAQKTAIETARKTEFDALEKERAAVNNLNNGPDKTKRLEEISAKEKDINLKAQAETQRVEREAGQTRIAALKDLYNTLEEIATTYEARRIERLKAAAATQTITEEDAEKRIGKIELDGLDRRIAHLREQQEADKANVEQFNLDTAQIALLGTQRAAKEEEVQRRIAAARQKDAENARAHAAQLAAIEQDRANRAISKGNVLLDERAEKQRDIEDAVNKGDLAEYVGKLKIIALQKQYNDLLTDYITQLYKIRSETDDPAVAQGLTNEIKRVTTEVKQTKVEFGDLGKEIKATALNVGIQSLTDNLTAFISGTKSAKDAFRDFALDVLAAIEQLIIKFLILKLVSKFLKAYSGDDSDSGDSDGPTGWFAEGGLIRGPGTGTSDSISARLSNNEFVQPAVATEYYGPQFMESIRRLEFPRHFASFVNLPSRITASVGSRIPSRFAEGGLALAGPNFAGVNQKPPLVQQITINTPNPMAPAARKTIEREMYRAGARGAKSSGGRT